MSAGESLLYDPFRPGDRVEITGRDHPEHGRSGTIMGRPDEPYASQVFPGVPMDWIVDLDAPDPLRVWVVERQIEQARTRCG